MDVDLHLHTTASDGTVRPADLVRACAAASLDVIAVADHDTILGSLEAVEAARGLSVHVVPAIEISASGPGLDLHILGYFIDPSGSELRSFTAEAKDQREMRLRKMLARLASQGVRLELEAVVAASEGKGTLGRPHLAKALVRAGHVSSEQDAFERFIGNSCPAYVPNSLVNPEQAIALIARAGGVAVWAHPPTHQIDAYLAALVACGLRGDRGVSPHHALREADEAGSRRPRIPTTRFGGLGLARSRDRTGRYVPGAVRAGGGALGGGGGSREAEPRRECPRRPVAPATALTGAALRTLHHPHVVEPPPLVLT